jgi:hypothetical protein
MKPSAFVVPFILAAGIVSSAPAQTGANYALICNGSTDFVASNILPAAINTFTMEAWVNPTAAHEIDAEGNTGIAGCGGQRYAIYPLHGTACWGAGHAGAGFSVGTNGVTVYEHARMYMPATLVYEGTIAGWTHVAVVYRDGVPSLYINGTFVKTGVRSSMAYVHPSAGRATEPACVYGGIGGGPFGYFAGAIDNVRIRSGASTVADIRASMGSDRVAGADVIVSFDMNRTGRGSGLDVAAIAGIGLRRPALGTTFGTPETPVFAPRADAGTNVTTESPSLQ